MVKKNKIIVGGAIGNCVHVAGVFSYLNIAENLGYKTIFLGAAVSPDTFIEVIKKHNPYIVCISYRLTPSALPSILDDFFSKIKLNNLLKNRLYYFGGIPGCIEIAKKYPFFSNFFQGEEKQFLIQKSLFAENSPTFQSSLGVSRCLLESKRSDTTYFRDIIREGKYYPMFRHHFGLSTMEDAIRGIEKIAESEEVDVISLAPDQNAQEYFFEPEKMNSKLDGSGGIPIRTENDLYSLWQAAQRGNHPLLRIYAGTKDLLKWAEISHRSIKNAWGAIPLFWYSILDGRSKRGLEEAIKENQEVIRWYAEKKLPVEINDPHHWSLRESSDAIAVADCYISAYNAKKLGVHFYIAQLMFNTPRLTKAKMDLAKMLAKIELISELEDETFVCLKQVRAGLTHFSIDIDIAKGQLAASTLLSLTVKPQIIHIVSFSEADHAAKPEDVIESCKIVKGVLRNAWGNFPDMSIDPDVQKRKKQLVKDAKIILQAAKDRFKSISSDPLADFHCLAQMVRMGMLDAPHLRNNPVALGCIKTMPINGGYNAVYKTGEVMTEKERVQGLLKHDLNKQIKS
jgi:hypothetical protein